MWTARDALDSLLWEAAVDDMGIYPRSVIRGDVETLRTEWQDGWNAAIVEITARHSALLTWVVKLTPEQRTQVRELVDADGEPVHLSVHEGVVTLKMLCGDTFMYACSDSEDFSLDDLPEIHRLWTTYGYTGLVAWIARKRTAEPVKEYRYNARFLAAKADLS